MVMDVAYILAIQEKQGSEQTVVAQDADHKEELKEPVYSRPLSPDLFDAMFNYTPKEQ